MTTTRLSDALASFGLTNKEVDAYLAILDRGETTVSTVAQDAGVSRRHVYNTAVRLEERGFVEVNDFVTPTKLRPVPPDRVEARLHEDVTDLAGSIAERITRQDREFDTVEVLKSRATLVKRIQQLLEGATDKVTLAIPYSLLTDLQTQLSEAVTRDVFVLLIVYDDVISRTDDEHVGLDGLAHAVRIRWNEIPIQLTVDEDIGLIAPRALITNPDDRTRAVAFGQSYLEPVIFGSFLGNEWQFAEEIYVNPPEELPKTYTNFRYATMQAAIHVNDGRALGATVEARPTDDHGPARVLEGEISEIRQRLIEPMTGSVIENAIDLRTDDGVVSIGGNGAFIEDYEAVTIRLHAV